MSPNAALAWHTTSQGPRALLSIEALLEEGRDAVDVATIMEAFPSQGPTDHFLPATVTGATEWGGRMQTTLPFNYRFFF